MNIAVIGSGHGGCATAAYLAQQGHDVRLYKLSQTGDIANFNTIKSSGTIKLNGIKGENLVSIKPRTLSDLKEIQECEVVIVNYVSNYHDAVAKELAPYIVDDQIVIFNPGYIGTWVLWMAMQDVGNKSHARFVEFETLTFSSRITSIGEVTIMSENLKHPLAFWPGKPNNDDWQKLNEIVGDCVLRNNILEVALHNPNIIIHTVGMLMNPTKIEAESKTFALYKDGFSPSVWAVVAKLDSEKMNVLESIGAKPRTYWDEFKLRTFGYTNMDSLQAFFHYANEAPGGPYTMNHRYLTEDVPKGLGMLQVLGRICKVSTPICDSLINIADSMLPGAGMKDMINMNAIKVRSCYEYFVRSDEVFGNILGS